MLDNQAGHERGADRGAGRIPLHSPLTSRDGSSSRSPASPSWVSFKRSSRRWGDAATQAPSAFTPAAAWRVNCLPSAAPFSKFLVACPRAD